MENKEYRMEKKRLENEECETEKREIRMKKKWIQLILQAWSWK